jgi:phosphohistidine swiveling domain-containing protein
MKKAQGLVDSAKSNAKKIVVAGATLGSTVASAAATVTVPTPDYTTFYSVVGVGLGVTLIVGLARKSKGFLK